MLQQSVQQAGLPQRREQVAVAGRAPLQIGVGRPRRRRSGGRVDLWLLMLDDLQRDVGLLELALVSQCLHRVIRSAERVHERDRQRHVQPRARGEHLTEDDVEEAHLPSLVAAHRQQRLRALQAHRGSQAAVELEECGLGERVHCLVMIDGLVHVMEAPHAVQRLDGVLADPRALLLAGPHMVCVPELRDGDLAHALLAHLLRRLLEHIVHCHLLRPFQIFGKHSYSLLAWCFVRQSSRRRIHYGGIRGGAAGCRTAMACADGTWIRLGWAMPSM